MSGMIHEKLDIKLLILYILKGLPEACDVNDVFDICQCDQGVIYFDFSDCLAELVDSGHVTREEGELRITDKGRRNIEAVENSLPYSVRRAADKAAQPYAKALARLSNIRADIADDGNTVHLSLNDGQGEILDLSLFVGNPERAKKIRKNFRRDAESYYQRIIAMLGETEK